VSERIKGQETSVTVTSTTNGLEVAFTDVKSCEIKFDREIVSEGYLGQMTEQKDDIFNGVSGSIEFHSRTADVMSLIERINAVSKGRLPGESINVVTTLRFPLGGARRIVIADCKFGEIPINIGSRKDFIGFKLDFASDDARILPAP